MTLIVHSIEEEPARNTAEASGDAAFDTDPALAPESLQGFDGEGASELPTAKAAQEARAHAPEADEAGDTVTGQRSSEGDAGEQSSGSVEPHTTATRPEAHHNISDAAPSPAPRRKARTSNKTRTTQMAGAPDKGTTAQADPRDIARENKNTDASKMKVAKSPPPPSTSSEGPYAPKTKAARATQTPSPKTPSKSDTILKILKRKRGVTLAELVEASGWQAHSVRGYLSGMVRKKLGLPLVSEKGADGVLRYRISAEQK